MPNKTYCLTSLLIMLIITKILYSNPPKWEVTNYDQSSNTYTGRKLTFSSISFDDQYLTIVTSMRNGRCSADTINDYGDGNHRGPLQNARCEKYFKKFKAIYERYSTVQKIG